MTISPSSRRRGVALAVAAACLVLPATPAVAEPGESLADGVGYRPLDLTTAHGPVRGHLLAVDLRHARLDLLHPGSVAATDEIPDLAEAQGALAGVNGDFFNISSSHEGVAATGASVGPAVAEGQDLKAAVPDAQRFGPALPATTSTRDVLGVGVNRQARVGELRLTGTVRSGPLRYDIEGYNTYALAEDGIAVFTSEWGDANRVRATCGSDTSRTAPCSEQTEEVVVRDGVVVAERDRPGDGPIPEDTVVLVGREDGAAELEALDEGDRVLVRHDLTTFDGPPLSFAVGGFPIVRGGDDLRGLDDTVLAPRTAAGVSADGRTVWLVVVDGRSDDSAGMTVAELAELVRSFGATDVVNLDGGGSSTMVTREPGAARVTVVNTPSDGQPRAVANGVGVFPR
ncbi:phosphodiester glycosidase family protein [Saccharomonospora piscinae]|uniref:phosphodiester glycosidase family protein n=1 Tax=Saccharomonospora piscinae TaxID=687388 RepID=UPI0011071529|nr:phosphodiester glycosidase family protein [Saccharomonospora piscinae]TLW91536.1 phosphodiester glycosidase family protein [Saccharomonospora piscinae]